MQEESMTAGVNMEVWGDSLGINFTLALRQRARAAVVETGRDGRRQTLSTRFQPRPRPLPFQRARSAAISPAGGVRDRHVFLMRLH